MGLTVQCDIAVDLSGCYGPRWGLLPSVTAEMRTRIGALTLPTSVKEIVDGAGPEALDPTGYVFIGFNNMTRVEAPGVTHIGNFAFMNCSGLSSVHFPAALTIGQQAFKNCRLTAVSFPEVQDIAGNAFMTSGLTVANFPSARSVRPGALGTNVVVASFPLLQDIGDALFARCSLLNTLHIPLAKTIGAFAFQYCTSLTDITLPAGITSIGKEALAETNLTRVTFQGAYIGDSTNSGINSEAFLGDLKAKYTAGKNGTYFRISAGITWTKVQ
jgi:hypothetical protein